MSIAGSKRTAPALEREIVRWVAVGALALGVAVTLLVPALRLRVLARLRGQPFHEGLPADAWALLLYDEDFERKTEAAYALEEMGQEAWTANLEHPNPRVRVWAVRQSLRHALDLNGEQASTQKAILSLCSLANDADPAVRYYALRELRLVRPSMLLGGAHRPLVNAFANLLHDDRLEMRRAAAMMLAYRGLDADAAPAVPQLIEATADTDERVRMLSASALGNIGGDAAEAVPALMNCLKDDAVQVRIEAAKALGKIGNPAATKAVPELVRLSKEDPSPKVKRAAKEALPAIDPKAGASGSK
jgi:HEAT repeat protein